VVSYSVSATLTRATNFESVQIRKLGMNSAGCTQEFSQSIDLTGTLPSFPITINTGCTIIKFLSLIVTGGSATIRLTKGGNYLDVVCEGTMLLSGLDLTGLSLRATPTGTCYIEVLGAGA